MESWKSAAQAGRIGRLAASIVVLTALLVIVPSTSIPAAQAADPTAITQGALDWGLKEKWRSYITGYGSITTAGGATRNLDGTFHFPVVDGTYVDATKATAVSFGGSVRFQAHCETDPCALDITVADPRVVIDGDGARLRARITGNGATGAEVDFARLDVDGVEPQLAGGVTTWPEIPTVMTGEGSSVFTYPAGEILDPLTLSYTGPGGKPALEQWTAPGTPRYVAGASSPPALGHVDVALPDSAHDQLLVSTMTPDAIRMLDADTLESKGAVTGLRARNAGGLAFDAASGLVFVPSTVTTQYRILRWDDDAETFVDEATVTVPTGPYNSAVYDPAAHRLYALSNANRVVTITKSGATWTAEDRGPVTSPSLGTLFVGPGGTVLATRLNGSMATLAFEPTAVPTALPAITGYNRAVARSDGGVYVYGSSVGVVRPSGGSFALDPGPVFLDAPVTGQPYAAAAVDPADDTLYLGQANPLSVIRDGELIRKVSLPLPPLASVIQFTGPRAVVDGVLFGAVNFSQPSGQQRLVRYDVDGVSPTVVQAPQGAAVSLATGVTSRPATFTAAAQGSPAPTVQWQSRPAGASRFADVDGATALALTVEATAAHNGTEYRAVFTNGAGSLATRSATLTVKTPPAVDFASGDVSVVEGRDALLEVRPTGNPYPSIQWQRDVGGEWVDVDGATEGFLTVANAAVAQSGERYRARLTNEVGTVYTDTIVLRVQRELDAPVDLIGGGLSWGIKESFRTYIAGPIAHGRTLACGGASVAADQAFAFRFVSGHYDQAAGRLTMAFAGTVRFTGHDGLAGPALDLTVSDPRVVLDGAAGTVYATVRSKPNVAGAPLTDYGEVALARLDLDGVDPVPAVDERFTWTGIPAALTPEGKTPFADFYAAGTTLDPVTVEARYGGLATPVAPDVECPGTDPGTGPGPGPGSDPEPLPDPTPGPDPAPGPGPKHDDPPKVDKAKAKDPIASPKGARTVSARGLVTVATLSCPRGGTCRVTIPKRVSVRIGGKRYSASVLAAKTVKAGRRGSVQVRLSRAATARLAGRRATVRVKVTVVAGGKRTTRTIEVTLKGKAKGKGKAKRTTARS